MNESKATAGERGNELPPPLELECLSALWRLGQGNVKQVQELLAPQRTLAYTTVMTLLERLAKKGFLEREKHGRSFHYRPLIARETVQQTAVNLLVSRLFEGSHQQLMDFLSGNGAYPSGTTPGNAPTPASLDASLL